MGSTARITTVIAVVTAMTFAAGTQVSDVIAEQSGDARQEIVLDAAERAFVLAEMRGFLQSVEGIVAALASERVADAKAPAAKSGMGAMHAVPPTLPKKLPNEFKMMGRATHQAFDAIAQEAAGMADTTVVLKQLEQILNTCNTCHSSYRLSGG